MLKSVNIFIVLSVFLYLSLRSWQQLTKQLNASLTVNPNINTDDMESKKQKFIAIDVTSEFTRIFYLTFGIVVILIIFIYIFGICTSYLAKSTNDLNTDTFFQENDISTYHIPLQLWYLLSMSVFNGIAFILTCIFCFMYEYLFISVKNSNDVYSMRIHLDAVMFILISLNCISFGYVSAIS